MITFTYDSCLLHTMKNHRNDFEIIDMQINDILILADEKFAKNEKKQLQKANFLIKKRDQLLSSVSIKFNDEEIIRKSNYFISLSQTKLCKNIHLIIFQLIDLTSSREIIRKTINIKNQYVAQRARRIYIAFMIQFESTFDLSFVAQIIDSKKNDIKTFNKRLQ